jgi:DNA polymerase/3'-5' exonuclease PolX
LEGIGVSIAAKIDEILATGTLKKLEEIRSEEATATINLLSKVVGVGPAKARALYNEGIRTIDDLVGVFWCCDNLPNN